MALEFSWRHICHQLPCLKIRKVCETIPTLSLHLLLWPIFSVYPLSLCLCPAPPVFSLSPHPSPPPLSPSIPVNNFYPQPNKMSLFIPFRSFLFPPQSLFLFYLIGLYFLTGHSLLRITQPSSLWLLSERTPTSWPISNCSAPADAHN